MKNKTLFTIIIAVIVFSTFGCNERQRHVKQTTQTVKVYKEHRQHTSNNTSDDIFIWWYIINYNNSYYYYSSSTPISVSEYSNIKWETSSTIPAVELSENAVVEESITVSNEALGTQMESMIDTTESQIDAMINEGNPNNADFGENTDTGGGGDTGGGSDAIGGGGGD